MIPVEDLRRTAQGAMSLNIAFIGVVNGLFSALHRLQQADVDHLARESGMDRGYLERWCDAAYAFGWLERDGAQFVLSEDGAAMRPEAEDSRMAIAVGAMLSAHMAERAAGLMRTGERPGEKVLAERETILPWFGAMLELNFRRTFEKEILPRVEIFQEINEKSGLVVDLGCGNGWYLRALLGHCRHLYGLGLDGFSENIRQAAAKAEAEGLSGRLQFAEGDIHHFRMPRSADLIAMNRALHHVWELRGALFDRLYRELNPGGAVVIWEPAWPGDTGILRQPEYRGMAFQNVTEHVQGNHFLQPSEISAALEASGFRSELHPVGSDVVVVGRRPD